MSEQLRASDKSTHPLLYMLLLKPIGIGLDEFLRTVPDKFLPFGTGPWPCLNVFSDHHRQAVIDDMKVFEDKKSGELRGKFFCDCGFSYSRIGPDKDTSDCYKYDRIIRYGYTWNNKMFQLHESGIEPIEFEKEYGVCRSTIHRRLKAIKKNPEKELSTNWRKDRIAEEKKNWLEIREANPELTRTQLREQFSNEVSWLERNTNGWIDDNMPEREIPKGSSRSRKNWSKRDQLLVTAIEDVVAEIKSMRPVIRASKQLICEKLNAKRFQPKIHKLPEFSAKLDELSEGLESFQLRRMKVVAAQLKSEGVLLRSRLIAKAGLSSIVNERHISDALKSILSPDGK